MEQVSYMQLREGLGSYLNRACYGGETFLVTKYSNPVVLIVPVPKSEALGEELYEKATAAEVRRQLSVLLDRVQFKKINLLVEKHNRPIAVLLRADPETLKLKG
jgi:antitoxin (DNA-binding transcriptional repressor) of toxin-antitoxin stability system